MPPRRPLHLFVAFALGAFAALAWRGRNRAAAATAQPGPSPATAPPPIFAEPRLRARPLVQHPRLRHRLAVATFAVVFFAGAAFTAGAGDRVGALLDDGAVVEEAVPGPDTGAAAEEAPPAEAAPAEEPAAPAAEEPAAPAVEPAQTEAPAEVAAEPAEQSEPEAPAQESVHGHWSAPAAEPPAAAPVRAAVAAPAAPRVAPKPAPAPVRTAVPLAAPHPDPEVETPGSTPVVWVNVALPDPLPPSARLSARFAKRLRAVAREYRVDWALLLGTYRAEGARGSLSRVAERLHGTHGRAWDRVLASSGRTELADRAVALARFDRAVGLAALVHGLDARKEALSQAILADERVFLSAAGRDDLQALRIDVRVLAVVEYLAESFGQVTVSSLETGHRLYARPGVISAHVYGRAVDVAALDGTPIAGNQEPGGLTEDAVRALLLLPPEVRPLQVISLLGLGGPSFPLADHADHIHVGF